MEYTYVCPCHFGIESVLSGEIKRMGGKNLKTTDGRVEFTGEIDLLARANLCLRTAERVLLKLGEFKALTFDDLFEGVKAIEWERWIDKNDAFPVKGHCINSKLYSVPDCQSIVKKAVVDRLGSKYKVSWFNETGSMHKVQFSIQKDIACLYIDTSGEGLHKRGYRKNATIAPIRETLACGIIDLAHVKPFSTVYDPFCGSGTFVIESALKALKIAPGIGRKFIAEDWNQIDKEIWKKERQNALEAVNREVEFKGFGTDLDSGAVSLSRENSSKAGVLPQLQFKTEDVVNFAPTTEKGIVLCNPPYGERLMEKEQAEEIIKTMGKVFEKKDGFSYYIISPHEQFEQIFGRKADKRRKLYNGMLKCQLYMYFK